MALIISQHAHRRAIRMNPRKRRSTKNGSEISPQSGSQLLRARVLRGKLLNVRPMVASTHARVANATKGSSSCEVCQRRIYRHTT